MSRVVRLFCLCLTGLFWLLPLYSQPADKSGTADFSNEGVVVDDDSVEINFENDGTQARQATAHIRIQSDAGVQRYGVLRFSYLGGTETLTPDFVRVRKPDGSVIATPLDEVQDMAADITREAPFYSDLREKHIAVKGLGVGDMLEMQAHWNSTHPLLPGQFWYAHSFASDMIVLKAQLRISIPRERAVRWKSALKPEVREEGSRRVFTWSTSNLRVKSTQGDEPEQEENNYKVARGRLDPPDVQISSFQSWEEIGRWYSSLQQERIQPNDDIRAKAAELTKDAPDDAAKIRALYDYVSTQFRYIGVAFGIGRYQPHAAGEVLGNQYGDCKDKHTLLASLLQAAGIHAYPALISVNHRIEEDVPSPVQFDHVITVVPKSGNDFIWLDTTAEVAPYNMLLPQLRDKPALVVSSDRAPFFAITPPDPPFPTFAKFTAEGKLSSEGVLDAKIEQTTRGDSELLLRTVFRRVPPSQWKDLVQNLSRYSGFAGTVSEVSVGAPQKTGSPFHFNYTYNRKDYSDWENRRIGPPFPPFTLPAIKNDQTKFSSPLWLGAPGEIDYQARIELPKGYSPQLPPAVNVSEKFADYSASYEMKEGVLIASRKLVVKEHEIPVDKFEQFKSFRKAVSDDSDQWIVLSSARSTDSSAADLQTAIARLPEPKTEAAINIETEIRDAAQRGDTESVIDALKRSVEAEPGYTRAWLFLADIYVNQHKTDLALNAFHKAIESDPKQPVVYKAFGYFLLRQRRLSEAVDAWTSLTRVAPEDVDGPANLGYTLNVLKRYSEATSALQAAIKLQPERGNLHLRLGAAQLRAGNETAGMAELENAIKLAPGPEMLNDAGYEMADAGKHVDEALRYSEQAVKDEETVSRNVELDSLDMEQLAATRRLSAYWDTLGWVHFHLGNLEKAESYLRAAWILTQDPVSGDHLGQVQEAQHKADAAIHMYRLAIAAGRLPGQFPLGEEETSERIKRLGGAPANNNSLGAGGDAAELSALRTTKLPRIIPTSGNAEFFFVFAPGPKLQDLKFIKGSDKLKTLSASAFSGVKFNVAFPQNSNARLVRRGIAACYDVTGCSVVLLRPADVRSVK